MFHSWGSIEIGVMSGVDDSLRGGRGGPGLTVKTEAKYTCSKFLPFPNGLCEYCPHAGVEVYYIIIFLLAFNKCPQLLGNMAILC